MQALSQALTAVPLPPFMGFHVRTAWRNALPSVAQMLEKHNAGNDNDGVMGSGSSNISAGFIRGGHTIAVLQHRSSSDRHLHHILDHDRPFRSRIKLCNFQSLAQESMSEHM